MVVAVGHMSRLRRDLSCETYVMNPDTLSSAVAVSTQAPTCANAERRPQTRGWRSRADVVRSGRQDGHLA
jgi:hypothetical protein